MTFLPLLLALSSPAHAQEAVELPLEGLEWQWEGVEPRSWFFEVEVQLPGYVWFASEFNKEARVPAYQVRMVMTCPPASEVTRRAIETTCVIDDIGLKASTMTNEQHLLPDILTEFDEYLTGANIQLTMRTDGRIRSVDLEGDVEKHNTRTGRIHENLRLVLYRVVAGLDLQLPRKGVSQYPSWPQLDSVLMWSPAAVGTLGSTEFVHQAIARQGTQLIIQTQGRGMVVPNAALNQFDTELEAMAAFDTEAGVLTERVWTAVGHPTASSLQAEGGRGFMYRQEGKLVLLRPGDEPPDVGMTEMVAGPGVEGTALPAWQPLGHIPAPVAP